MLAPSGPSRFIIAGLALLATSAVAATTAGPVDVEAACVQQYGSGWAAHINGPNAFRLDLYQLSHELYPWI